MKKAKAVLEAAAEWVAVADLVPWPRNPRINASAIGPVAASIKRFGFGAPIVARLATREVIAGHTRLEAAKSLGMEKVPVRFLDLSEAEAHALALADNKLGELAEWDDRALAALLAECAEAGLEAELLGFAEADLERLEALAKSEPPADGEDDGPGEVPATAVSQSGEIYALGPHRLACCDSTDADAVARLFGGSRASLVWTDPPYGVDVAGGTHDPRSKMYRSGGTIQNDALDPDALEDLVRHALRNAAANTNEGASAYVASPTGNFMLNFMLAFRETGFVLKHTLAWVKDSFVFSRCDYHYRHETILYGWKDDGAHFFVDDRKQDSVFEVPRPKKSESHPTMKPVELVERMVANSSREGELVFDPFTGSGTTLIACAKLGRRFVGCELDPKYCDVIRKRWTAFARSAKIEVGTGGLD